ncbi:hypothetical protein K7711_31935 [Nocardia sp. CA2R105]|uniref:hypothetical protein n=1 Tax=Nocardia coffeae TaxID=2873381 RepID=UPI001CA6F969|nr:hypothetical protein [Nocardia coffeae]MBY8861125.1 hypothetical protein [Nocardia coffeae]
MSTNASEVDQITGEVSSLGHKVNGLINTWRSTNPKATRVPRTVRRDINRLIKLDNQQRQFAHAQERAHIERRVIEYRWNLLRDRDVRSWDNQQTWFERQQQLAIQHEQLRAAIYTTGHLTATERGQADRSLSLAHQHPRIPIKTVFGKTHGLQALAARAHDGFTRLRAGLAGPAEQHRLQQWQQLRLQQTAQTPPQRNRAGMERDVEAEALRHEWAQEATPADIEYAQRAQQRDFERMRAALAEQPTPVPNEPTPAAAPVPESAPVQPQVTVSGLNARIDMYAEVLRYRDGYDGDHPEQLRPIDHANAAMRQQIIADARTLGPDQAALVQAALNGVDHSHRAAIAPADVQQELADLRQDYGEMSKSYMTAMSEKTAAEVARDQARDELAAITQERDQLATRIGQHQAAGTPAPDEPERKYEVVVGSTRALRKDWTANAKPTSAATLAEAYNIALDRLADENEELSVTRPVSVLIYKAGSTPGAKPAENDQVYTNTAVLHELIAYTADAQEKHGKTQLAQAEQAQERLRATQTENASLRTENTRLVRKFADNDRIRTDGPASPTMPSGPKLARPIFSGPVLPRPAMNGLDR